MAAGECSRYSDCLRDKSGLIELLQDSKVDTGTYYGISLWNMRQAAG
jgi:hypothetical protein